MTLFADTGDMGDTGDPIYWCRGDTTSRVKHTILFHGIMVHTGLSRTLLLQRMFKAHLKAGAGLGTSFVECALMMFFVKLRNLEC